MMVKLVEGQELSKLTRTGAAHSRLFYLSKNREELCWSKKKGKDISSISMADVSRIQKGASTEAFQKQRSNNEERRHKQSARSFSVVISSRPGGSLNIECSSEEQRDGWVAALQWCADKMSSNDPDIAYLRSEWNRADTDHSGSLSLKEVRSLLKRLNIVVPKAIAANMFDSVDVDDSGDLNFAEFVRLRAKLLNRPEFDALFSKYSGSKAKDATMSVSSFSTFLSTEQSEKLTTEQCELLLTGVLPTRVTDTPLTRAEFVKYLCSRTNGVVAPASLEACQDMTRPLNEYFIASSHNTYLEEDQLRGRSTVNTYISALHLGCRCVELDCWDGPDGEPIIYHGFTLTSRILFQDVIQAIRDHAFAVTPYPLILSFENHCSVPQQKRMADIVTKLFGDMLLTNPDDNKNGHLPSPERIKKKIIIKAQAAEMVGQLINFRPSSDENSKTLAKRKSKTAKAISGQEATIDEFLDAESLSDGSGEDDPEIAKYKEKVKKAKHQKVKIAPEFSRLVYLKTVHFSGFEDEKLAKLKPWNMSSFSESKFTKISKSGGRAFASYNNKQISRTYPAGKRVNSSNYDPCLAWAMGCQLVALNYQTPDVAMCYNEGKFELNGRCGYVLKPDFLRNDLKSFDLRKDSPTEQLRITVTVISGKQLPKPKQREKGEVVDPYVKVQLSGVPEDSAQPNFKTKTVEDNGFNPVWRTGHQFTVHVPELAMLGFMVYDEDKLSANDFLAYGSVPVNEIRNGYRFLQLKNHRHESIQQCGLLLSFSISKV
eukprot:166235_1